MEAFLSQSERSEIQKMYTVWLENLKADDFAEALFAKDMIRMREKEVFDSKTTGYKKSEYMYEVALTRITYEHLKKIRQILVGIEQVDLARRLPVRPKDDFWLVYDEKERQKAMEQRRRKENRPTEEKTRDTPMDIDPPQVQDNTVKSNDEQPSTTAVSAAQPERPANSLAAYVVKPNNAPGGKGYCLVIANYTNNLQGYNADIESIRQFFRDTLGYVMRIERNLIRDRMLNVLQETRSLLQEPGVDGYDSLFVFVLSHGDKNGIQTCLQNGNCDELNPNGTKRYVKPDEVIGQFTHNSLPALKEFPKAFFFQMCQGKDVAVAAGGKDQWMNAAAVPNITEEELAQCAAGSDVAVGADILACFASPLGYFSWVDRMRGSWLIEVLILVFKEHYQAEHLLDMITEVNKKIATKTQQAQVNGTIKEVHQIPCIKHNLTRKFFLCNH